MKKKKLNYQKNIMFFQKILLYLQKLKGKNFYFLKQHNKLNLLNLIKKKKIQMKKNQKDLYLKQNKKLVIFLIIYSQIKNKV